jgi:hypothetical protein
MSAPRLIRVSSTHKTQKEVIGDIEYLTKQEAGMFDSQLLSLALTVAEAQLNHLDPGYSVLYFDSDKFRKNPGYVFAFSIPSFAHF